MSVDKIEIFKYTLHSRKTKIGMVGVPSMGALENSESSEGDRCRYR
jgi:hypothetical protein